MSARNSKLQISLPPELRDWVGEQAEAEGFRSPEEFVRSVVRSARDQHMAEIEAKLDEAIAGGPPMRMTKARWDAIRRSVQRKINQSTQSRLGKRKTA